MLFLHQATIQLGQAKSILAAVRVFPPHDNEMKPLWRYVEVLEKTGKGQGGNTKSRFIISILFLYYHTMKYGRFELGRVWLLCEKVLRKFF